MLGAVGIGILCLVIGFALGQNQAMSNRIAGIVVGRDLEEAKSRLAELEAQLIDARLSESVQREASNVLRNELTEEHGKRARLAEEVAFYKGLMAPSSLTKGLQITELEVVPLARGKQYSLQLLLTQVALRRSFIAGDVRVDVIGRLDKADSMPEAVLSLTELAELRAYPLKFRFRYFQDLTARITLPDGFLPDRVLVTAKQNGKDPLQATFPWP